VHAHESLSSNNALLPSNFILKKTLRNKLLLLPSNFNILVVARLFGSVIEVLAPFADYIYYSSLAWFYLTK
jgi:hypothetical protein